MSISYKATIYKLINMSKSLENYFKYVKENRKSLSEKADMYFNTSPKGRNYSYTESRDSMTYNSSYNSYSGFSTTTIQGPDFSFAEFNK